MLISEVAKNAKEKICVILENYKGHDLLNLRVFYDDIESQEWRPTKKGICIPLDKLPEIRKSLEEAQVEIDKRMNSEINEGR